MKITKSQIYWMIIIFAAYMALNIFISGFYSTLKYIPYYADSINWPELILSGFLATIIGILISINAVLTYSKIQQKKNVKKEGAAVCIGTVAGFSTGVCSACVSGIIPLLFSAAGLSFSFASLPFKGIEIQFATIGLLGLSLYFLKK